jgi:hypothetical protein
MHDLKKPATSDEHGRSWYARLSAASSTMLLQLIYVSSKYYDVNGHVQPNDCQTYGSCARHLSTVSRVRELHCGAMDPVRFRGRAGPKIRARTRQIFYGTNCSGWSETPGDQTVHQGNREIAEIAEYPLSSDGG